jgi:hypothetical protein
MMRMRMAMPENDWLGNLLDHGSIIHIVNGERATGRPIAQQCGGRASNWRADE